MMFQSPRFTLGRAVMSACKPNLSRPKGFTLIELMIVVAIVAIIAAVAYPAYTDSVLRSHRAEARTAVMDAAARQEKRFSATYAYTADMTELGYTADPWVTDNGRYSVAAALDADGRFTITATALGVQVDDRCDGFSVNFLGQRGVSEGTVDECWSR